MIHLSQCSSEDVCLILIKSHSSKFTHHRTIVHNHGNNQIAISIFDIDMMSLLEDKVPSKPEDYPKLRKTKPAGLKR